MNTRGFTIIELIIVIAILGILSALILIQVDPARRLHQANNATRWSHVLTITEGIKRYQSDNDSVLPATAVAIDSDAGTVQIIGESVSNCSCAGQSVKAAPCGVSGLDTDLRPYLASLPTDPVTGSANDTRYFVNVDAYEIVTVGACDAEGEGSGGNGSVPDISVTK